MRLDADRARPVLAEVRPLLLRGLCKMSGLIGAMRWERSLTRVRELTMIEDKLLKWRFRRGRREVLARIYEKYVHLPLSIALGLLNNAHEAEDETHESAGFGGNFQVDSRTSQLWLSIETGYPVLAESEVVGNDRSLEIRTILDQFQWDVDLDPAQFQVVIPPGYRRMEIQSKEDGAATLVDAPDGQ
jgi:hypothetical protein